MRLLRALAGTLLWVLAAVLGLVGAILCVTLILLPVGLVVFGYARRLFTLASRLMAPRTTGRAKEGKESAKRFLRGHAQPSSDAKSKKGKKSKR